MSWFTLGAAAVGMVKGKMDGDANKKRQKGLDASRKATIAYSPWSGMGDPGAVNAGPQGGDAVLGGGMQGAMVGQSMQGLDFGGGGAAPGVMNQDVMQGASQNALGGQTMAADLGGQFKGSAAMPMSAQVPNVNQGFQSPGMGGSAGAMGSTWGGLQSKQMDMDPTKNMFAGMYPQSGSN